MRNTLLLLFMLAPFLSMGIHIEKEVEKRFEKSEITSLNISNKYGDIIYYVSEEEETELKVVAFLRAEVNEYNDTSDLSVLDIIIEQDNSTLNLQNRLAGNNSGALYSLDFVIYGPDSINLAINHQIGNAVFPALKGKKNIRLGYGNLTTPHITGLRGDSALLNLSYGKLICDSIALAKVNLSNTETTLNYIYNSTLKSNLSIVKVNRTDSLRLKSDGDRYLFNNSYNLVCKANRSLITIDNLWRNAEFVSNRGKLTIRKTQEFFGELNVDLTGVESIIQFKNNTGFYFNAIVNEGSLALPGEDNISIIDDIDIDTYIGDMGAPEVKSSKFTLINKQSKVKIAWIQ